MRKTVALATGLLAALALAAAPALAGTRVGDRVGSTVQSASDDTDRTALYVLGAAILVAVLTVASDDASESD